MPHVPQTSHRLERAFVVAAVATLMALIGAVMPARAQAVYGTMQPSVTVNYGVLDHLGPPPQVADGRFVMRQAPVHARVATRHVRRSHPLARREIHHPLRHMAAVVQIGSVTIDYAALPARVDSRGPRLVLRRPGTPTVAVAATNVERPEAPPPSSTGRHAPSPVAVATAPQSRAPSLPMPVTPPEPRMATAPTAPAPKRSDLSELSSLLPIGGVALAATRSPAGPVSEGSVPQSTSRVIRFAPGVAELQGDASMVLARVAQNLKANPNEHIELVAYASGDAAQAIEARRVSLVRAVLVRDYLIEHGVASTQIDVRALGNRVTDGGSADRVDLVTAGH